MYMLSTADGHPLKLHPRYYGGLSGIVLPIPKYRFPENLQHMSRLQYYATFFNSIEINSTFYNIPKAATLKKWSGSLGDSFQFTLKMWQGITHVKPFKVLQEELIRSLNIFNAIGNKKGCLLFQFPPSVKSNDRLIIEQLLACVRESGLIQNWKIALEFRHNSWYNDELYQLMNAHTAALVIHDKTVAPSPWVIGSANFIYLRFHGPGGDYKGSYETDFLREYAEYINAWLAAGKTVYVYFNNTAGDAFNNLRTLNTMISE